MDEITEATARTVKKCRILKTILLSTGSNQTAHGTK